jgi:hypothetical protein
MDTLRITCLIVGTASLTFATLWVLNHLDHYGLLEAAVVFSLIFGQWCMSVGLRNE